MTTKLTKKEYTARKNEIVFKTEALFAKLEEAKRTDGASLAEGEDWNDLHDQFADLIQASEDLEQEWDTRNWTASDWTSWNLIANNVD